MDAGVTQRYAGVYTIDWSSPCGFEQPVNGWTIEDQGRWLSMVEFVGKDSIVVDWTDNKKGAILMTHSIAKRALDMMSISARARFQKATAQQVAFLPID